MRIVILASGTWGDVRPNVVLAQALQQAGYDVLIASTEEYRAWIEARGVPYARIGGSFRLLSDTINNQGTNFIKGMQTMQRVFPPALLQIGNDLAAIVREGDVLLVTGWVTALIDGVVEKHKLRLIHVNMQPTIPTGDFPPSMIMALPVLSSDVPFRKTYNVAAAKLAAWSSWLVMGGYGNQLRRKHLALPKQKWKVYRDMLDATPSLLLASRHVIPQPADWQPHQRVTGYIFDDDSAWQPPQDLLDFLDAGEKPIYIGFGSMGDTKPAATTQMLIEAARRNGKRALLLSGWAGFAAADLPKDVFLLKYAPHHWLFPRVAAVVQHGGAGTVAAALRAGVPSIIVPMIADQAFWGRRIHELGVGTQPIPRGKLNAENLSAAIVEATSNRTMQDKATTLGKLIAAEDGIGEAVTVIQQFLK